MFLEKIPRNNVEECIGEKIKKVRLRLTGRVQGVGIRYTIKLIADKLDIKGTIHNESDGSVLIEAVAKSRIIDEFIEIIQVSPSPYSLVKKVEIQPDKTIANYNDFSIIFD